MDILTARQAAEQWGVSLRYVQALCKSGRIAGAERTGRDWLIPAGAKKPGDRRRRDAVEKELLRKAAPGAPGRCPFPAMTSLYHAPGGADQAARSLRDPLAAALFRAQIAYFRGEIDAAHCCARSLLDRGGGFDTRAGVGMLLSLVAVYRGDTPLWNAARDHIASAPVQTERQREQLAFWLAAAGSALNDAVRYPEWFRRGCFEPLQEEAYPAARYFYIKYLFGACRALAAGGEEGAGLGVMRVVPAAAEPLISQSGADGNLLAEIYLRLLCAAAGHDLGDDSIAAKHLDRAIALALPDRLYVPLAEYQRPLDFLLSERLRAADPEALRRVRTLNKQLFEGWTALHNTVLGRSVSNELTVREREIAKLASYDLSNQEIARRLNVSIEMVKKSVRISLSKTGAKKRRDLGGYI